eukprot:4536977-Amphidinium_carterae.1
MAGPSSVCFCRMVWPYHAPRSPQCDCGGLDSAHQTSFEILAVYLGIFIATQVWDFQTWPCPLLVCTDNVAALNAVSRLKCKGLLPGSSPYFLLGSRSPFNVGTFLQFTTL